MGFKKAKETVKQENIKKFIDVSESLNTVYMIDRKQLSNEWIQFNTELGKSIVELYNFSFALYKKYNLSYKEAKFYSFYFDFLVSKPSNSIFTETPKETGLDLFVRSSKKVALLSEHLYNLKKSNAIDIKGNDTFNKHFQELFTNIFSYLDFIFYEDKGVFSKFSTNKDLFLLQKKHIETLLSDDSKNISDIKSILQKLHINNIEISTNYKEGKENIQDDLLTKDIFKNFVNYQSNKENDPIIFEIFSYVLSNKLWKFVKILQRQPEYKNIEELHKMQEIFLKKIKLYIKQYLEYTNDFYNATLSLHNYYLAIHKIDYEFINEYLFVEILTDIEDQKNDISDTKDDAKHFRNKEKTITSSKLIDVLKPIINNEFKEKFKLYRLIAKSSEITLVIDILHQHILDKNNNDLKNIEYIGLLRSGSFLAHSLNILKCYENDSLNTRVVSLLTHPYLSILPRTFSYRKSDNKRFIYIDEAIKSGYGISISDIYRKKILSLSNKAKDENDIAISIADMIEYDKDNPLNGIEYSTIIDVTRSDDKKELYFKKKQDDIKISKQFKWIDFINDLQDITSDKLDKVATVKNQLDATRVISDSVLLFKIAKFMVNTIVKETKDFDNLLFYSGSTEGSLLIDTLTFVYKIIHSENKNFYINAKTIKDDEAKDMKTKNAHKTIFVDITKDSGYTQENVYKLDVNSALKNSESKFDLSLFIFARKTDKLNDTDKYITKIGK
jgi:hypothetical protein